MTNYDHYMTMSFGVVPVKLPTHIDDRYALIYSIFCSHKGKHSKTASALNITINTVKKAVEWHKSGRQTKLIGRPIKLTRDIKCFIAVHTIYFPETSGLELSEIIYKSFGISIGGVLSMQSGETMLLNMDNEFDNSI